ncbi:hypothetical protein ACFL6S_01285 [Candidatus Poribacteria bacterium]
MDEEKAISPEELEEVTQEADENDRRVFLKTAAKVAGAVAVSSAMGALIAETAAAGVIVEDMEMNVARNSKGQQLSFSGRGLGKALQAQGLIPSSVKNLNKASIEILFKW